MSEQQDPATSPAGKDELILVAGAGGFIGGHLVKRLKSEGYLVRGVDIKEHEFAETAAHQRFIIRTHNEIATHGQPAEHAELHVGANVERSGIQQVSN